MKPAKCHVKHRTRTRIEIVFPEGITRNHVVVATGRHKRKGHHHAGNKSRHRDDGHGSHGRSEG